jgi:hypothetical protein
LHAEAAALKVAPHPAWRVDIASATVTVHATGLDEVDPLSVLRATAHAVWTADVDHQFSVCAGDDTARHALQQWALL